MRGDNHVLAITTTTDEITGETKPLFSFPVQVCKATDDKELRWDIAAPSGAPRAQTWMDTANGETVVDGDCIRGVRMADGTFRPIPKEQIEEIDKAVKIETMVALGQKNMADIDFARQIGIYYLQSPVKGGVPKAYRLLYEALREVKQGKKVVRARKAIITKRTPRSKQKLCVIYPNEQHECLMLAEFRYAHALREPDEAILAPRLAQVTEKQITMARQVIDALPDGQVALDTEQDEAVPLKQKLIEQALAGEALTAMPTQIAETSQADDLEALLEASLVKS